MKKLILIFFATFLLVGCKGVETISQERTVRDSVVFRDVERPVLVPGYSLEGVQFNLDSLVRVLQSGVNPEVIEKTLIREDPETRSRVKILIDELGNLTAVCEQQEQIIKVLVQEREIYKTFTETIIQREKENFLKQIKNFLKYALMFVGVSVIIFVVFRLLR